MRVPSALESCVRERERDYYLSIYTFTRGARTTSVMIPSPTYNFTTPVVATYMQAGDPLSGDTL
jgi:hypothetical protein